MKKLFNIILLVGLILPTFTIQAQTQPAKKDIGLQLYSVRSLMGSHVGESYDANYVNVLKKLADMGYTGVEAAGYKDGKFYNTSPSIFKKNVESVGMKIVSSHATKALSSEELASGDFSESLKWWESCIAAHKAAGMKYIVTPWLSVPKTKADLATEVKYLNEVGKLCRKAGIKYGYHNHSHEFVKVEDVVMYDYMIEHTDPENVFFEMDVYWTVIGKASPVDYFNKYPGRFKALHIKDHREIGQSGMVGFDAIFANTDVAGVEYIFVELEEVTKDLDSGLKQSIDYLLNAPFVKKSYSK